LGVFRKRQKLKVKSFRYFWNSLLAVQFKVQIILNLVFIAIFEVCYNVTAIIKHNIISCFFHSFLLSCNVNVLRLLSDKIACHRIFIELLSCDDVKEILLIIRNFLTINYVIDG